MTKILLIEDEPDLAENITTILEINGFEMAVANNGTQGLELAKKILPDLIISDIIMPEMDGYKLLTELRDYPATAKIPLIFLTAKVEYFDLRKGMDLGADDYIFKPFISSQLISAIRTRLNRVEKLRSGFISRQEEDAENQKYKSDDVILLDINNSPSFIKIKKICCIKSERQYSKVYVDENRTAILRKSLNDWEKVLPDIFIRVHRSYLLNVQCIIRIEKLSTSQYKIYLNNDMYIISSRRYTGKVKEIYSVI